MRIIRRSGGESYVVVLDDGRRRQVPGDPANRDYQEIVEPAIRTGAVEDAPEPPAQDPEPTPAEMVRDLYGALSAQGVLQSADLPKRFRDRVLASPAAGKSGKKG